MSCAICGRGACCVSFHSLEAQEDYDKIKTLMNQGDRKLAREVLDLRDELKESKEEISKLECEIRILEEHVCSLIDQIP